MTFLHERPASRKPPEQLDLLSWFPARGPEAPAPAPRAVRKLSERFGISLLHASTVASLVGIPAEGIS